MSEKKLYYMLNKPQGYITARKDEVHHTVMEFFPPELSERLFPVGRLDKDTEGLLLFTDDGQFDQRLMHPDNHASKTYLLYAMGRLNAEAVDRIEHGQWLTGEEKITKSARITIIEEGRYEEFEGRFTPKKRLRDNEFNRNRPVFAAKLTISEGRKHQVKRMLLAEGCRVIYLKRIEIAGVALDETLRPGEYRALTDNEYEILSADRSLKGVNV